jgi:hypothetical protein
MQIDITPLEKIRLLGVQEGIDACIEVLEFQKAELLRLNQPLASGTINLAIYCIKNNIDSKAL